MTAQHTVFSWNWTAICICGFTGCIIFTLFTCAQYLLHNRCVDCHFQQQQKTMLYSLSVLPFGFKISCLLWLLEVRCDSRSFLHFSEHNCSDSFTTYQSAEKMIVGSGSCRSPSVKFVGLKTSEWVMTFLPLGWLFLGNANTLDGLHLCLAGSAQLGSKLNPVLPSC